MVSDEILFSLPYGELRITAEGKVIHVRFPEDGGYPEETDLTDSRLGQALMKIFVKPQLPPRNCPHGDIAKFCPKCGAGS